MHRTLRVAVVGDFDPTRFSHWATEAALFHAAQLVDVKLELEWIGTEVVAREGAERCLEGRDGLWGSAGSPYRSSDGMLAGIRFARERGVPYLGTCGGFQYALIEFTRNVLGLTDADTAESGSSSRHVVITPVQRPKPVVRPGAPLLSGTDGVLPVPGTLLAQLCSGEPLRAEYYCSFETNADYVSSWQAAGLCITGLGEQGELRAFSLPSSRFFLATLFQPQLSSRARTPHPIITGFLRACAETTPMPLTS
jgi:CTP synthase (UTP-ammonia lyase)